MVGSRGAQAGLDRSRMGAQGPLWADKGNIGTYSQRTIKDVNTAVYADLTAPWPPQKGKQAGEKDGNSEGSVRGSDFIVMPLLTHCIEEKCA